LKSHSWPGNIRELEHAIEKTVILADSDSVSQIQLSSRSDSNAGQAVGSTLNLEAHEKTVIQQALRQVQGNVSAAAKELGINRSTLYQKMKKYGL
jgi:transcriptional regulator of acetoin/glycerol metabolism